MLSIAFVGAVALGALHRDVIMLLGVMALAFGLLSVAVTLKGGIAPYRFPSTSLFLIVAVLSAAGWIAN